MYKEILGIIIKITNARLKRKLLENGKTPSKEMFINKLVRVKGKVYLKIQRKKLRNIEGMLENMKENNKRYSKEFWILYEELLQSPMGDFKEIKRKQKGEEELLPSFERALEGKGSIERWYTFGENYVRKIKEMRKMEGKPEISVREKIHKKIKHKSELSLYAIKHRTQEAEKVYRLFKGIGRYRIKWLRKCTMTTIKRCRNWEIQKLIERFRDK